MLNGMSKVSFHLINRSCFRVKAENERFTTAGSRCRRSLKFDLRQSKKVRRRNVLRYMPHVQHDYFSFSQWDSIIDLWLCRCRRRRFFNSLIWSLRSTTRRQRQRHKFFIFDEQKQKLCSPFTCFFSFCTFRSRQMCDVEWPFLKFYRKRTAAPKFNFLS